jgi:hypothetical protein
MKRQPTTQQITWFLDLHRNKQLDLEPPYQRKSVWSSKDRKFFLDTIFRNYPAPPVFIHRTVDDKGYTTYHVVDGKQRLETILRFFDNKISIAQDFGDANLDGKKFRQLPPDYKRKFWDYTLVVDFIDSIDGNNIEEVFDRVNRNARNLQPQELRHARFNGWFIEFVENETELEFWWDYKISTRGRDRRMKNTQFISELMLIILDNKIVGFDQDYLDSQYAKYDDIEELVENGELDQDGFISQVNQVKQFIIAANNHNECIDLHASGAYIHFYTLWAYIYLNRPADPIVFADRYFEFMNLVDAAEGEITAGRQPNEYANIYRRNSTGAATDYQQRIDRYEALLNFMAV